MRPNNEEKRHKHPGFGIQFEDGSWLCYAHGYFASDDAFYADVHETESSAKKTIADATEDFPNSKMSIVVAWEPLCENLRHTVGELRKANKISPEILFDVVFDIENALARIK